MRRSLSLATVAFALLIPAAQAEDSPQSLALAKQVMELNGSTAAYEDYNKNLDHMVDQLKASMPGVDDATIADIKKIAVEEFTAYRPTLIDGIAHSYAKHFSERDLKALVAFYRTEAGKHFAAETPAVTQEILALNAPFTRQFLQRIREYFAAKIAAEAAKTPEPAKAPEPASPESPKDKSK